VIQALNIKYIYLPSPSPVPFGEGDRDRILYNHVIVYL